jgi:fatty-acyl-CoA synthase
MWGTMMTYQLTLGSILERAGTLFESTEIVSRKPDGSLHHSTYADLHHNARALAEALRGEGLKRGDRVGTLMHNHHVHLDAYFGVTAAGGVLHTINLRLHPNDIQYIINHAQDRFLIVDDVVLPTLEQIKTRIDVERIFVVCHSRQPVPRGYVSYEELLAGTQGSFAQPSLHENEAAVLCYTSGTSGSPKGIAYSHRALVLHSLALSLPDVACIAESDVVLPVVPMYHANAWGLPLAATMMGAKQVFPGTRTDAASLLELFSREQVTLSAGVPVVWLDVQQELQRSPGQWKLAPGMRALVSGSAPPETMIKDLDAFGIRLFQAWGLIESGPLATVASLSGAKRNAAEERQYDIRAGQGRALPFVDLRVIGDSGEVPHDGVTLGEAQLRGPWVAGAYYNLPELRGKWTDDGWFRTGDVVSVDKYGEMKIADRAKDLIKSGDDWISSVDLENALMGHPSVQEAAVIAVMHPSLQERPLAAVVLKQGMLVTTEDLREFLLQRFANWQLPDAFVFVTSLPHTPTGKLLKKELRKQFRNWKWEESQVRSSRT